MNTVLLTNGQIIDKQHAHIYGLQHYAFSIFIFNSLGELLLQQRAHNKYHSGGLWTNSCCSHPLSLKMSELTKEAELRLSDEMGINCTLNYQFQYSYKAHCGDLIENEIDFIFFGFSNDNPIINQDEVNDYQWRALPWIRKDQAIHKEKYTEWFHLIINLFYNEITNNIPL